MRARRLNPGAPGAPRRWSALREEAIHWITRRHRADGSSALITRDRVYILPTRQGYLLVALLLVMLLGSINYSNNMAFLLTFLVVGIGHNAMWYTHRNLLGLRVSALPVRPVFAGSTPILRLRIEEPSGRAREALRLAVGAHDALPAHLAPRGSTDVEVALDPKPRGLYRLPRQRLSTHFPLGLLEAWTWLTLDTAVLVYPRPVAPTTVATAGGADSGEHDAHGHEQRDASPDEIRDYRLGDPPSRVAWKAVARSGRLFVRDFSGAAAEPVWLDWTMIPHPDPEYRLSVLCHLVLDAHEADRPYGLRLPGTAPLGPAVGPDHLAACLRNLALFGQPGEPIAA